MKKRMFSVAKKMMAAVLATSLSIGSISTMGGTMAIRAVEEASTQAADATTEGMIDSGLDYDYARALQYSMYFYDANMCGTDVDENSQLSWRGDCHTNDAMIPLQPMDEKSNGTNLSQEFIDEYKDILDPDGDGYVDVSGGMHDAGDHVKFGMPENYTAATLGWGYYEFRDSYEKLDQTEHIETILRYFNDYLMKCTFRDKDGKVIAHCYQVGDGDIDHAYWQAPEVDSMSRPAFFLNKDKPYVDYLATAAASLVINYFNFKDTDPDYAAKSLDYGKALWNLATELIPSLAVKSEENPDAEPSYPIYKSENGDGPKQFYTSNEWKDDYCWAGTWLYEATEDVTYLNQLIPFIDYYAPSGWCYCWNDMWSGAITKLAIIDDEHPELDLQNMYRTVQGKTQYEDADFWKQIVKAMDTWMNNYTTPGGYAFLSQWGSARYNTAMQLITLIYEKYHKGNELSQYAKWAESQMKYIMGNNPLERCYIVGYNEKAAKYPHHRAASGLLMAEDTREQKHVLYGALVGGPDGQDAHIDETRDYIYNEVTIDYNAAFVGASAALYEFFGTDDMAITKNFPPVEVADEEEGGSKGYWVEAFAVDDINNDGAGVTKISLKVMTNDNSAKKDISVKYFFNTSEISDISKVEVKELYDQASAEEENADGVISGPFKYDNLEDTYYYEITWDGYTIANSGKKYQACAGMYWGDLWDPTNDYSYQGLPVLSDTEMFANGNEVETPYICVYSAGTLVGGIEPDGTTPSGEKVDPSTATTTVTEPVTTEKPSDSEDNMDVTTAQTPDNTQGGADVTTSQNPSDTQSEADVTTSQNPSDTQGGVDVTTSQNPSDTQGGVDVTTNQNPSSTQGGSDATTSQNPSSTQGGVDVTTNQNPSSTQGGVNVTTSQNPSDTQGGVNVTTSQNPSSTQGGVNVTTSQNPSSTQGGVNVTTSQNPSDTQGGSDMTTNQNPNNTQNTPVVTTEQTPSATTQVQPGTTAWVPNTTQTPAVTTQVQPGTTAWIPNTTQTSGGTTQVQPGTTAWVPNTTQTPAVTTQGQPSNTTAWIPNTTQTPAATTQGQPDNTTAWIPNTTQAPAVTTQGQPVNTTAGVPDTTQNPIVTTQGQSGSTTDGVSNTTQSQPNQTTAGTASTTQSSNTTTQTAGNVSVIDITLPVSKFTLQANKTVQLNANVFPSYATDSNLLYMSSDTKVATVSASGQITAVAPGTATIRVIAGSVVKKVTVTVKPAKVSSVKKKNLSASKVKLTWKKQAGVTGYKIYQYNTKSKKFKLRKTVKKNQLTIANLKKNQTYKFKIKAYKKSNGVTISGSYSKTIIVKK